MISRIHHFHIPVMGTSFTIDCPLRVGKFGISSCVSLGDDHLIEGVRRFWSNRLGRSYTPISSRSHDARAMRITAYLDFLQTELEQQCHDMRTQSFETDSDLDKYFQLLPGGPLSDLYSKMLCEPKMDVKSVLMDQCRAAVRPGAIEVNIMTKVNRERKVRGMPQGPEMGDALAALRGFLNSKALGSVVFSAGLNPRLYSYAAEFDRLRTNSAGQFHKAIILKVSDYRSASVQGQFLAKKGLWVSEFRIESGLNCGGHAFAKDGMLLGPVLQEFAEQRTQLYERLSGLYHKACLKLGIEKMQPPAIRITAQGGIGTAEEDLLLREHYQVDGTGWGTPFLLVPEVCMVDPEHLTLLQNAGEDDVFLSRSSPFGLPFWSMHQSASERLRKARVRAERPGSPCRRGYLAFSTEFGENPLCFGSRKYQQLKLEQVDTLGLSPKQRQAHVLDITAKACICDDLSGAATRVLEINQTSHPAICPGPNIKYFSKVTTLSEMVDHIYGRGNLLNQVERPHMFVNEVRLYADHLRDEIHRFQMKLSTHSMKTLEEMKLNLLAGLQHYLSMVPSRLKPVQSSLTEQLERLKKELECLMLPDRELASCH